MARSRATSSSLGERGRVEAEAAGRVLAEHPVEGEGVEVDVQVEPAPEALDDGEGAGVAVTDARSVGLAVVEVQESPDEDAEDGAAEAVVPGEQVAQAVGEAQDPLADGDAGQHTIHEVGGALGHAPTAAARAEATALAGEGDQPLQGAGVAPEPREAVGEDAAGEELAELLLDEAGQAGAVGALGRCAEKGLQVGADDGVEDAALGVAWAVGRAREDHGPQVRPKRGPGQCPKSDTPRRWGPM
ncbi:MAG: hypothetical protein WAP47_03600 [Candidatus Rokuibacteriota bacterium]